MNDEQAPRRIRIMPGGPYLVQGATPLVERYPAESVHGEPLAWDPVGAKDDVATARETYALCRCGQSSGKPYCDGTHARAGFEGTLTADLTPGAGQRRTLVGTEMIMTDEPALCVHAGFCGSRLSNVWDMMERTGDPEVRARVQGMIANCPSGRLEWAPSEGAAPVEPGYTMSVAAVPDGPLWVRGGAPIETADGTTYPVRNRVTLCRCGASANKPYCDGTHKSVGFSAPRQEPERAQS